MLFAMCKSRFLNVIICVLLCCVVSCTSNVDWHFSENGTKLLIQENDVPQGWILGEQKSYPWPEANAEIWLTLFNNTSIDSFLLPGLISHHIMIFGQTQDAVKFIEEDYQFSLDLAKEVSKKREIEPSDFAPSPKHIYNSSLADEIRILYYPEVSISDSIVGYNYYVWARYGNVVSTFITIVEDPETTQITAEEANVVPWSEVEQMLKRIDEKFAAAGKEANQ